MTRGGVPVLDSRRIDALAAELNYRADAVEVVGRFVERLPDRLLCVHENLRDGARERALTAVLSVATSAAMTGALRLEAQSREVERQIRAGDLVAARSAAWALDSSAAEFAQLAAGLFGFQPLPAHGSVSEPMLQAA